MYFLCRNPYANRAIVDNKNCKMIKENNSKMQLGLSLVNLFVVYFLFAVADHLRLFVFCLRLFVLSSIECCLVISFHISEHLSVS